MIRHLIGQLKTDLIHATDALLKESGANSCLDIQRLTSDVSHFSEEANRRHCELIDCLYEKLIGHHCVVRMHVKADKIVAALFNAYCELSVLLPGQVQQRIDKNGIERIVCDDVAEMIDRFAILEHEKLFSPSERP